ncbi:MAG: spondin domain-containing protein [Phycisphaerales bacterium]|nr:spondin domain-containing protein [Phycisphaerales bacterium]
MHSLRSGGIGVGALALMALASGSANAAMIEVTVENLAPMNSVSFAPLRIGFNSGTYDSFDAGSTASAAIVSIAEGGSGADWFPAFMAADPSATLGTVVPNPAGPLVPGATGQGVFDVDGSINPYFTFGAMAVPSNDYFIGNDSPTEHEVLDASGNLLVSEIVLTASDLWDAGSEVDGIFGAAFLQGSSNSDRIADNDPVGFDFADLSIFDGSTTAAGYVFESQLDANTPIYRISFAAVPEPATGLSMLLSLAGVAIWRRR